MSIFNDLAHGRLSRIIPDKMYINIMYYYHFRKFPDLDNPESYNEKLQWLKLHDRKDIYTTMVDKIAVKDYIASKIGKKYVVPIYAAWDNVKSINLDELPNEFILKCNHDSQSKIICFDKNNFDIEYARKQLKNSLKRNGFWYGREWPYKNVKPQIFAEKLLKEPDGDLKDYKVLCFNGEPKLIETVTEKYTNGEKQTFYDVNWQKTDFAQIGWPMSNVNVDKPDNLDEMIGLSKILAQGLRHIRVDWYNFNHRLYFGELTFFDGSGFVKFEKQEDDILWGSWIKL